MNYLSYVNIQQGTKSCAEFSGGNTLPLVQLPFAFAAFSPQTRLAEGWFYHPDDSYLHGIRLTHQPSPWIKDRGVMIFMPGCEAGEKTEFDNTKTVLNPHYLKYVLKESDITIELTPSVYGAVVRLTFGDVCEPSVSFFPAGGSFEGVMNTGEDVLYCSTDYNVYETSPLNTYFAVKFNKGDVNYTKTSLDDKNAKIFFDKKCVAFEISTSFISFEQSVLNLNSGDFDVLKSENERIWNKYLGRIEISADENIKKTFYSCMYRSFLFPHRAYEINKDGNAVHYAPCDSSVKPGYRYTDIGFWDGYRTLFPLLSIIAKDEYREIVEGFIQDYKDGGWLPRWSAVDAKNCMPSTLIDAVIADGAAKGLITGELLEIAFEGMEKNANQVSANPAFGRCGCDDYLKLGYVPCDKHKESVNLTLDAAYCDWCLAVVADILGFADKAEYYRNRSENYKNLFDKNSLFMVGRYENGDFRDEFNPLSWGGDYTEASAYQTSLLVQHDFDGLAELYGGCDAFINKLDELFALPPEFDTGAYGKVIHEMAEMAARDFGQCAICNQPSFHIPFIYAHFGYADKTSYWVKKICSESFSQGNAGFPGDEDNGAMASWYIFATLGLYPLCPGKNEYVKFKGLADSYRLSEM